MLYPCVKDANRELKEMNRRTAMIQRRHDGIPTPGTTPRTTPGTTPGTTPRTPRDSSQQDKEAVDESINNADETSKNKSKKRVGVTVDKKRV